MSSSRESESRELYYCAVVKYGSPRCTTNCARLLHGGRHCSEDARLVWCGRCHRHVEPEAGTGTAWTLWVCPRCRGSVGVRIKPEDIGPVDVAALDTDYEPIYFDGGRNR